jgi:hypothetical protein
MSTDDLNAPSVVKQATMCGRNSSPRAGWAFVLARLGVGSLFVMAGVGKIWHPEDLAAHIAAYRVVPEGLIMPLAEGLPILEILAGLLTLWKPPSHWQGRVGILTLLILSTLFTGAIGQALLRGIRLDCGCFGSWTFLGGSAPDTTAMIMDFLRDILLTLLCLALYLCAPHRSLDDSAAPLESVT